jgi:hypothetical protein
MNIIILIIIIIIIIIILPGLIFYSQSHAVISIYIYIFYFLKNVFIYLFIYLFLWRKFSIFFITEKPQATWSRELFGKLFLKKYPHIFEEESYEIVQDLEDFGQISNFLVFNSLHFS